VLQLVAGGKVLPEPELIATGLVTPEGLAITDDGQLLVVESSVHRLSAIDLETGEVTPVAEDLALGAPGWPGLPPTATFNGVALDAAGVIYVAGDIDNVLYRIAPA
jgi:sugar lactone lactonase YvrE